MRSNTEMIKISVEEVGSPKKTVQVEKDSTVRAGLEAAGVDISKAKTITIGGEAAELDYILDANDEIYVIPNLKGNK